MMQSLREIYFKETVCAALLVPLLIYSFFSVGTMPIFSSLGFEVVICYGDSIKTITVNKNGEPIDTHAANVCDWSLLLHDSSPAIYAEAFSQTPFLRKQVSLFAKSVHFARKVISHIQARGPPAFL